MGPNDSGFLPILSNSANGSIPSCSNCQKTQDLQQITNGKYIENLETRAERVAALARDGTVVGHIAVWVFQDGSIYFDSDGCLKGNEVLDDIQRRIKELQPNG